MISTVDKLLLSTDQQAELERLTRAYQQSAAIGDAAGMEDAHARAQELRASAGYSGGASGDRYELLKTADAPAGYSGYEALIDHYAGGGMNAIAAGYEDRLAQLDEQRNALEAQAEQNQAGARSAVWNAHRLAADGLLNRGLENTGLADVITATALNQASANAYQALLDRQQDLQENDAARISARADALNDAADLQAEIGGLLGDAYQSFYDEDAARRQQILLQQLKTDAESQLQQQKDAADLQLQKQKDAAAKARAEKDYYYTLALQQLKRKWELEDQAKGL